MELGGGREELAGWCGRSGPVGLGRVVPAVEGTHEWFLKMCAFGAGKWDKISDKFRHIATILELCDNFRQSATVLDKKNDNFK